MKTYIVVAGIMFISTSFAPPLSAHLDSESVLGAGISLDAGINYGNGSSATINTTATTSGKVDVGQSGTKTIATTSTNTNLALETDLLVVTRNDVSGGEDVDSPEISSVDTKVELESYARALIKNDENVRMVKMSSTEVSISHKARAKLLGFVPINAYVVSTIDSDGRLKIDYPWYALVAVIDKDQLEAELHVAAAAMVRQEATASTTSSLSLGSQARLLEELRGAMNRQLEKSLSAEGEVEAEIN
jgi:hypothetical protein